MIIDGHAHAYHGKHFDKLAEVGGEWARKAIARELKRAEDRPEYLDVALAVKRLDRLGYDLQVVTPLVFIDINCHPASIFISRPKLSGDSFRLNIGSSGSSICTVCIGLYSWLFCVNIPHFSDELPKSRNRCLQHVEQDGEGSDSPGPRGSHHHKDYS